MTFEGLIDQFVDHITNQMAAHYKEQGYGDHMKPTKYRAKFNKKYVKIIALNDAGKDASVFCFIRIVDGAVFKSASWNTPAKHTRGNICDPTKYGIGLYGANYLRGLTY